MANDVGPTNPGAAPVVPDLITGRVQVDYSPANAAGQSVESEEAVEEVKAVGPELFVISSVNADTLTLTPHNGDGVILGGSSVLAAKPYRQRRTPFDGNIIDGKTYTYSSNIKRMVLTETESYIEIIDPPYSIGKDLEFATKVNGPSGIDDAVYKSDNTEARRWSRDLDLIRFKVVSVEDDYIVCIRIKLDGTNATGAVNENILKPRELRRSIFDGESINGRSYVYESESARTVSAVGGGPFDGEDDEEQIVIPPYEEDDVILAARYSAAETDLGTPANTTEKPEYMDYNFAAARAWAVEG